MPVIGHLLGTHAEDAYRPPVQKTPCFLSGLLLQQFFNATQYNIAVMRIRRDRPL